MKDELSFPAFTHDSIAGYCNGNPLYAQYKNDKKSKYIGTKQMWQELSKLRCDLQIATKALESISGIRENTEDYYGGVSIHYQQMVLHMDEIATNALEQIEHKEQQ